MNICFNGIIIDKCLKFLTPMPKYMAHVVIAQYEVEYNFLITFKFNGSIEISNE